MNNRRRPATPGSTPQILGRLGLLVAAMAALALAGRAGLPNPPLDRPWTWPAWWAHQPVIPASFGLLRWAALGAGAYLALVNGAALAVNLLPWRQPRELFRRLHFPGTRSLVWASAGLSLASLSVANPALASAAPSPPPVMHALSTGGGTIPPTTTPAATTPPPTTPAATTPPPPTTTPPAAAPPATAPPPTSRPASDGVASVPPAHSVSADWIVRSGDHLWAIAQRTLTSALGHPPDERTLATYWWKVVEVNRARLPDPGNIDLLYPGDHVLLPPIDSH